jgi:hypothetical protein
MALGIHIKTILDVFHALFFIVVVTAFLGYFEVELHLFSNFIKKVTK